MLGLARSTSRPEKHDNKETPGHIIERFGITQDAPLRDAAKVMVETMLDALELDGDPIKSS